MNEKQHAPLAPSSAQRIVACTGSRKLESLYPQEPTIESREGDAAHWALSELLNGNLVCVGQIAGNGVTLNDEMLEAADMAAAHIEVICGKSQIYSEMTLPCFSIHAQNWGTPDAFAFSHNPTTGRATIELFDFKFGHGYINVFENYQLINYVAAIVEYLQIDGGADALIDVNMTIIQPRCYHRDGPIRTWATRLVDLRGYFNILVNRYEIAMQNDAPVTINPECKNCSGRFVCEALSAAAHSAADHAYSSTPLVMCTGAMSSELRMLRKSAKMLDARITGLEEQIKMSIQRGVSVPYFSIKHGSGRTMWTGLIKDIILVGKALGIDLEKPAAITPLQAIKAGMPKEVVLSLTVTPKGAADLVEDDGTLAESIFKVSTK